MSDRLEGRLESCGGLGGGRGQKTRESHGFFVPGAARVAGSQMGIQGGPQGGAQIVPPVPLDQKNGSGMPHHL